LCWALVAHACNPSYLGDWDWEASLGKKFMRSHLNQQLGVMSGACHPSEVRKPKIGGWQSRQTWTKVKPYLQNNQSKRGWRHGSSHGASA
jgi:hypothetical protein